MTKDQLEKANEITSNIKRLKACSEELFRKKPVQRIAVSRDWHKQSYIGRGNPAEIDSNHIKLTSERKIKSDALIDLFVTTMQNLVNEEINALNKEIEDL